MGNCCAKTINVKGKDEPLLQEHLESDKSVNISSSMV